MKNNHKATVRIIADMLGLTPQEVYRLMLDDVSPSIRIGNQLFMSRKSFLTWLSRETAKAASKL